MRQTALLVDPRYAEHRNPAGHPERSERIEALLSLAEDPGRDGIVPVAARPATRDEILAVHTAAHFDRVAATAGVERTVFDADTSASPRTFETALLACGGLLAVVDAVMAGSADNGCALVRPPGHHAESGRIMGFCFFNNVAVGAAHLRRHHGLERILIVDWDVHHGNGTQEIFWEDPDVLYVSLHEYPCYPGGGASHETGAGAGAGATVNVPLPAGCGDAEFVQAFDRLVEPAARRFDPDFVLVSAGFDAHGRDPLASMSMTEEGYVTLTRRLMAVARDTCDGRLAAVLEGGYDLVALEASVRAVLGEMGGEP
jgi:acetoin utilization deacetylase AcuC-like enzyme